MQSISIKLTAPLVAVFLFCPNLDAAIFRVPTEVTTIQAALDTIVDGDTILVSNGNYAEELTSPEFGFTLLGDVALDTGLYQRPIVDPSTLTSPTTRTCLRNLHGEVVVERMWFRNGAAMHPHVRDVVGGLRNETANLTVRDCVFDSTYRGVVSNFSPVTFERCMFRTSIRNCIYVANATLQATDCEFECINTEWSSVIGGSSTYIERCHWFGDMGHFDWWLAVYGNHWIVRNNVFGPGGGSFQPLVNVGGQNGLFEDNLFTECISRGTIMGTGPSCEGVIEIRRNVFRDCEFINDQYSATTTLNVQTNYDSLLHSCSTSIVEGNVIENIRNANFVEGILITGRHFVTRNILRDLNNDTAWTVVVREPDLVFRDNFFDNTGNALMSEYGDAVTAEYNWWGHASGPFHADSNQLGQGDEVGDNVDFDPWYTDTLFFSASPEPRPPMPERATLMAYPNPFNAITTLHLTVTHAGIVRFEIFDITGRRVKELWSGPVGDNKDVVWQAGDFASGLYFARAWDPLGNRPLAMTKMVLLK